MIISLLLFYYSSVVRRDLVKVA